jgi:apolipoprotein N-acyltransferase
MTQNASLHTPLQANNQSWLHQLSLVVLSGLLLGLSVNEWRGFSFSFTAWIAFVPFFWVLKSNLSFRKHALFAYLVSAIYIAFALGTFLISSAVAGIIVIILGSVLFSFPLVTVFWAKKRIGFVKSLIFLALLWPLYDLWFLEKFLEMPIFTVSICQSAYPELIQYIDSTGYGGIATWIITLNLSVFLWLNAIQKQSGMFKWIRREKTHFLKLSALVLLHFVLPLLYFGLVKALYSPDYYRKITVNTIQEAYPDPKAYTDSSWVDMLVSYVERTDESVLQDVKPDLVVWPENAIGVYFKENEDVKQLLLRKVLQWETTLLSGAFDIEYIKKKEKRPPLQAYLNRDYHLYNSALLLTPQFAWSVLEEGLSVHQLNLYRKEHTMPFTEKVPLSETFPWFSNFAVQVGNLIHLTPGKNEGLLRFLAKGKYIVSVQPLICWDLLFSHPEDIKKSNPDFVAGIANESHFGKMLSTMPNGIVGYSRMRSIEYRRSIVKASPQGFTFTMNPFGEITHRLPWLVNTSLTSQVELSNTVTFYQRYPLAYSGFCFSIIIFIVAKKSQTNKDYL